MAAVTICSDFGAQEKNFVTVSIVTSSIFHEVMGLDATIFVFWMLSFKPAQYCTTLKTIQALFITDFHFTLSLGPSLMNYYIYKHLFPMALLKSEKSQSQSSPDSMQNNNAV